MKALVLLLLTIFCGYVTYKTFCWQSNVKNAPFSAISDMWKDNLDQLSVFEKESIKGHYSSFQFGVGKIALLLLVLTIGLAFYTVQAFVGA